MFGPSFIHRRIKPLYEALQNAGFKIDTENERYSSDAEDGKYEFRFGISSFRVVFENGISVSVIDYYLKGDDPKWEIGIRRDDCKDWFSETNLYETESIYLWRFKLTDLETCVNSFEQLALQFGK
jgi:hypothetical protein